MIMGGMLKAVSLGVRAGIPVSLSGLPFFLAGRPETPTPASFRDTPLPARWRLSSSSLAIIPKRLQYRLAQCQLCTQNELVPVAEATDESAEAKGRS